MKQLLFLLLLLNTCLSVTAQKNKYRSVLTPAEMTADFDYLRQMLEATSPGLYAHQSPERVQFLFDSVRTTLQQPLSFLQFYGKIAFMIAEIHCEHSYSLPGKGQASDLFSDPNFFPLQLDFTGRHPVVLINGTSDTTIHPGDEIQSINGRHIDSLRRQLYAYMPADGFITTSKAHALSSMQFSYLYAIFIEQPKAYEVVVKKRNGQLVQRRFDKELNFSDINSNAMKNPVNQPVLDADRRRRESGKKNFDLEPAPEKSAAFLTISSFSTNDHAAFKNKTDSVFRIIGQSGITNLVIDLSYNGGGEEGLAAYLMSYLTDKPIRWVESEYLVTDKDEYLALSNAPGEILKNKYDYIEPLKDGKSMVKLSKYSMELETVRPQPNRFAGQVFLYVNGQTASSASTFAAIAQSNKTAVIVGEETAGSYKGGGIVIGLDLTLPNSGILTHTSLVFMNFATQGKEGSRGTIPDFEFKPVFDEKIGDGKAWKRFVMNLFR